MSAAEVHQIKKNTPASTGRDSRAVLRESVANEFVFAVVGHVGSGTSEVAEMLKVVLTDSSLPGGSFDTEILKARREIQESKKASGRLAGLEPDSLQYAETLQDIGDDMRRGDDASDPERGDHAAVARALVRRVRLTRAGKLGISAVGDDPVEPNRDRRAYILDSIRHPAEVHLLRSVYQSAFVLIGVVCDEDVRLRRLMRKYSDGGERNAKKFMERDAKASEKYGQRVSDAFHLADVFLDNSEDRLKDGAENEHWEIPDELRRLVEIITHSKVVRPRSAETAMYFAYGAQMRSACLSRQVGAALVDQSGNVVATGTNEVPRAGGGVYGESFADERPEEPEDHRCVFKNRYCSNTREQNELIDELIEQLMQDEAVKAGKERLTELLKDSRISGLLEFSRAVHAEMDALLAAARKGATTAGTRAFVTTYPCHYCARHLVAAGVDEVQYIEPYPKSRAKKLHGDSISHEPVGWVPPSDGGKKVLFRPFVGVAPRLYRRAFLKDRELKDATTGDFRISQPEWSTPWDIGRISYVQLEAQLSKEETTDA